MGTGETWELLETMFALGASIITFAIFWCCVAACCYRRAQRRNARRQPIAVDGNELEAIPPVLPAQPVAYGWPQPGQYLAGQQVRAYPVGQPPIAYPGAQAQYQPLQAQHVQYQQPQVARETGIVYGH
jgi:hypothetical protein